VSPDSTIPVHVTNARLAVAPTTRAITQLGIVHPQAERLTPQLKDSPSGALKSSIVPGRKGKSPLSIHSRMCAIPAVWSPMPPKTESCGDASSGHVTFAAQLA